MDPGQYGVDMAQYNGSWQVQWILDSMDWTRTHYTVDPGPVQWILAGMADLAQYNGSWPSIIDLAQYI